MCGRAEPKSQSTEPFSELNVSVERYSYLLEQVSMLEKMENKLHEQFQEKYVYRTTKTTKGKFAKNKTDISFSNFAVTVLKH